MTDEPPKYEGLPVRGVRFRSSAALASVQRMTPGDALLAEREPRNEDDSSAIAIRDWDGVHIGYVGREYASEVAEWMDKGWFFETRCNDVWPCLIHYCHVYVDMTPIRPRSRAAKVKKERVVEDA